MAKDKSEASLNNSLPSPPPQVGEGMIKVAYHTGPEQIGFFNRDWVRDVAQMVTADNWAAMQARGDFGEFNFLQE